MIQPTPVPSAHSSVHRVAVHGLCTLLLVVSPLGCASKDRRSSDSASPNAALEITRSATASSPADTTPDGRPVDRAVVIDGSTLDWSTLRTPLTEAAGALVLEEIVLDRSLAREAARAGLVIGEDEIRAEEAALLDELAAVTPGETRMDVLEQIRRARGLGPARYESLLRRNAVLRALVRDASDLDAAEIELARRLAFGETLRVRLFVAASEAAAARARTATLEAPAEARSWIFAEQAAQHSTHASAPRGGLIDRFHPEDPAFPGIVGSAVADLEPGALSPVLATAGGFAVVLVESIRPGRTPDASEADRVAVRVRLRKERLAMEQLARELIDRARVSPIDPDLARAWRDRR